MDTPVTCADANVICLVVVAGSRVLLAVSGYDEFTAIAEMYVSHCLNISQRFQILVVTVWLLVGAGVSRPPEYWSKKDGIRRGVGW